MKLPDPLNTFPEGRLAKFHVPEAVVAPDLLVNVTVPDGVLPVAAGVTI